MINFKHLTKVELAAYSLGTLETGESHEIGRHLLNCAECRRLMPMPSVERFWSAVMTEKENEEETFSVKSENSVFSGFILIPAFFKRPKGWVLSWCALLIFICFSALLWLNQADSQREVSQSFEIDNTVQNTGHNFPTHMQNSGSNSDLPTNISKSIIAVPTPKFQQTYPTNTNSTLSVEKNLNSPSEIKNSKNKNISSTRNISAKCENGQIFETETVSDNTKITLKWRKIPKAAKYHLFVSDENEILVDEFETIKETSYTLKILLDSGKVYRWKIVVVLENGETLVSEAQEITAKDYRYNQSKSGKVRNSAVRCSNK